MPLWKATGPARIEGGEDASGGHLLLTWDDGKTRYALKIPNADDQLAELAGSDAAQVGAGQRLALTREKDMADRRARFQTNQLLVRLPREMENLKLGMTREQVLAVFPPGSSYLKQPVAGGVVVTFKGQMPKKADKVAREIVARFDPSGQVTELRFRYVTGPATGKGLGLGAFLSQMKTRCGSPEESPGPAAAVWSDLPARKPAATLYRWQDDATHMTLQRDANGLEVVLRDCPVDAPGGLTLPPLTFLPRGPKGLDLGASKAAVLKAWNVHEPEVVSGALVLTPKLGPFDSLLLWFQDDRVSKIVARHVQNPKDPTAPAKMGQGVMEAWTLDMARLHWPWRQDFNGLGVLQGWANQDDLTRTRIFWQESNSGPPRLFTEWKDLGGNAKLATAAN